MGLSRPRWVGVWGMGQGRRAKDGVLAGASGGGGGSGGEGEPRAAREEKGHQRARPVGEEIGERVCEGDSGGVCAGEVRGGGCGKVQGQVSGWR